MAIINHCAMSCAVIVWDINILVWVISPSFCFLLHKHCNVLYGQGQDFPIFKYECKSTIPCWLLRLAFLLSACELPVMSACVSREAAASRAETQECHCHDTATSGFFLGNPSCSTPLPLQHSLRFGKGTALICHGPSELWLLLAGLAGSLTHLHYTPYLQSPISMRDGVLD